MTAAPHRLSLDTRTLQSNWRALDWMSGDARCGAAVKADGYGLGAVEVVRRLLEAGCRDFFVATWAEARGLAAFDWSGDARLGVLHGVRAADLPLQAPAGVRPVLNTAAQVARWREVGGGACDVMVDTGMNRLGVAAEEIAAGLLDGIEVATLMSHLASADEDDAMNERQRARFASLAGRTAAQRMSLANSAGIALGQGYHFDLTRPGLALYGGVPRDELGSVIRPVARIEAEVLQRRLVRAGDTVGYNATWRAPADTWVGIVNLGYADGYPRGFSNSGTAWLGEAALPVIGRVSMDLTALDLGKADVGEGDWVAFEADLRRASAASGISQYELLTGLGKRLERCWR